MTVELRRVEPDDWVDLNKLPKWQDTFRAV